MTNDYQTLFEDKCKECENLASENTLLKRDIENLQEMVEELQTDVETYQELNDEMTSEMEMKDTEYFDLKEELDRIQSEFGRKSDKYIKQIQGLQKEVEEHKKLKVQMETQIEKFVRNERLVTNRAERAEHKLADIEEDMVILKSQFEDERDEFEKQILRKDRRIKDFEDDVRVKTNRIKDLEGSIPNVDPTPEINDSRRERDFFVQEEIRNQSITIPTMDALKIYFHALCVFISNKRYLFLKSNIAKPCCVFFSLMFAYKAF